MSFFDDVINTTKNAAQTAGKKTDEAVRFTKLKIKESQTSRRTLRSWVRWLTK